jgi:hypothetical protein
MVPSRACILKAKPKNQNATDFTDSTDLLILISGIREIRGVFNSSIVHRA